MRLRFLTLLFRFATRGHPPWTLLAALAILPAILIAVGCSMDGTFHSTLNSTNPFVGLLTHWGYWATFILTPLIIFLTTRLFDKFVDTVKNTHVYCVDEYRSELDRLVQQELLLLKFRARSPLLLLIIAVFLTCWLLNCFATSSPSTAMTTFGNDVFDSRSHPHGYYVAKGYLLVVMVVVYAWTIFVAIRVSLSMNCVFLFIDRNSALRVDLFHTDHCGGLSQFGNINLIIFGIYGAFSGITLATAITHTHSYLLMFILFPAYIVAGGLQNWFAVRFSSSLGRQGETRTT